MRIRSRKRHVSSKTTIIYTHVSSTLRIKHLEGTSWQTDFDLAYDYLIDVHIYVDNSGVIYFTSESMDPSAWSGSVFKVTSTSTAQDMVGSSYSWLEFPTDIDIDDMGNPIVSYFKRNSDSGNFEIHLAVYENSQWKDIAGDFSNAISPIDIESNNGLYFIYGDGTDLVNNIAASFKTIKLTH